MNWKKWSKKFGTTVSYIVSITCLIGVGFGAGNYLSSLNCTYEKIELQQEFNEKLQSVIDNCRELELSEYRKPVEDLKEIVKDLRKQKNGKKSSF